MRIGLDIDDTIADTYEIIFVYALEYTLNKLQREVKLNFNNVRHHDYTNYMFGWTQKESDDFWDIYFDDIVRNVKPFTLASEVLRQLKDDGHEIIFITARYGENAQKFTEEWLEKNNFVYDKVLVDVKEKGKVAQEENIDVFMDDSLLQCEDVYKYGIKSFLMNTRTNRDLETGEITRVYTWPDFYNKLKSLTV